jgi:hypothetical protein
MIVESGSSKYFRVGAIAAFLHAVLFLLVFFVVINSEEAQIQLLYIPFMILDLPISLLYWFDIEKLKAVLESVGHPWLAKFFYGPLLIDGILGTIWWYYVPKFFLPRRLGGIWGSKAVK